MSDRIDRIVDIVNSDLPRDEKQRQVNALDPERNLTEKAITRMTIDIDKLRDQKDKREKIVRSLNLYVDWETEETYKFKLQPNDCSRFHKALEALGAGLFFDGEKGEFAPPERDAAQIYKSAKVFVVKHDWAAVLDHDEVGNVEEFKLPYPMCVFEFRVMNRTILLHVWDVDVKIPNSRGHTIWFEGAEGVWLTFDAAALRQISEDCFKQVRAICVVLEAQVAEHSVVRAPSALNAKREKQGKPPLSDYHVIDLSRRHRAAARGVSAPTGRRVRMHFRRGHWRHFETHRTWINWMLVGNPDLGFIDKEYRI